MPFGQDDPFRMTAANSSGPSGYVSQNSRTRFDDMRSADASFVARWAEERRLCAIVESEQTSTEEKYQALIDLAYLSGVLADGLADAA
jgi:hypothetical protein